MLRACALVGWISVLSAGVFATPCALVQIPTADVLDKNTAYIDFGGAMYDLGGVTVSDWVQENQVALFEDVEFGYDWALDGSGGIANIKWAIDSKGPFTLAVGSSELHPNRLGEAFHYVVATQEDDLWRYHYGVAYGEHWHAFLGAEYYQNEHLTWMADWINGPTGAASVGFNWTFGNDDEWGLMVGAIRDNANGASALYLNVGGLWEF